MSTNNVENDLNSEMNESNEQVKKKIKLKSYTMEKKLEVLDSLRGLWR
jgi:hypothetical protein